MGKKKKRGGSNKKNTEEKKDENVNSNTMAMENETPKTVNEMPDFTDGTTNGTTKSSKFTVEDLMQRVDQCLENFEHEMALKFCEKALKMEPDNMKVHECYGNVYAEVGDIGNAKKHFNEAVRLEPDVGHVKYLYLGQLTEGRNAVEYYEKGIMIMKSTIEYQKNNESVNENEKRNLSNSDIANVYCSLAEIFMTDCCMDEDAEQQCEKYCKLAVETDEKSLDAAVSMSSLLLNQSKMDDAKISTVKAFDLWSSLSKEIAEESIPEVLSYEARVTLIKLLIECESFDKVSPIVDQLIEENEDDIRIWYYLGLSKSLMEEDTDNPRFYLEKALELIEKTGFENEDMVEHINELLQKCPPEDDMDMIEEEGDEEEDENDEVEENGKMDVE